MHKTPVNSWIRKILWKRDTLLTPAFRDFLGGSDSKESACNAGGLGLIPGLGRSPGGGHGNPLQYFCLENPHGQRNLEGYSPCGSKESDSTEWPNTAQYSMFHCMCLVLSHVLLSVTPWTVAYQAPLSVGFSWQEYWSGLPFPSTGIVCIYQFCLSSHHLMDTWIASTL